jgi:hypothetical protein
LLVGLARYVSHGDFDAGPLHGLEFKTSSAPPVVRYVQMRWTNPFHHEIYRAPSVGDIVQGIGSENWAITTESQDLRRRLRRIRILQGDGGNNPGISVPAVLYCLSNSHPTPILRSELCFPNRRRTAATFKDADYKDDERNCTGTPPWPRVHG